MRYVSRLTDSTRVHQGEEAQQIATLLANFLYFVFIIVLSRLSVSNVIFKVTLGTSRCSVCFIFIGLTTVQDKCSPVSI